MSQPERTSQTPQETPSLGTARGRTFAFTPMRTVAARPRLFIALAVGVVAYLVLPWGLVGVTRSLVAWNLGTWLYLVLACVMMAGENADAIHQRALVQDENRFVILALSLVAAAASFGAIVMELASTKDLHGWPKVGHIALVVATIFSAWAFIHLMFTLHYAHEYANQWRSEPAKPANLRRGLNFPDTDTPDYGDFLYFAFVIGVASQTADVAITSPSMRRLAAVHGIFAFFFNTTLLALTINIAAGLI